MNGDLDRLRVDLYHLAEQVRPVDLSARVLRTAQRRAARRSALVGVAVAAAVLVTGAGTALALRPGGTRPPAVVPTAPAGTATPTAPAPATAGATAAPTAPAAARAQGIQAVRRYYINLTVRGGTTYETLYLWQGGRLTAPLTLPGVDMGQSLAVAPDGSRLAWVDTGGSGGSTGQLVVADGDGGNRRVLRGGVDSVCDPPTWAPDSQRLLVTVAGVAGGPGEVDVIDTATGATQRLRYIQSATQWGCYPQWSADGRWLAFDGAPRYGEISIADAGGTVARSVSAAGPQPIVRGLISVSPDATRAAAFLVAAQAPTGDAGRSMTVNAVIDTRTGQIVPLPVSGPMDTARFLPDGDLLVRLAGARQDSLVLIGPNGRVADRVVEPAQLHGMVLVAVVPGP